MYQLRKRPLPILLPSMVEAENISDHSLEEREEEKQEHLGTIRADEPKPNAALTTDEEVEIHQQREEIYKLKKN